MDKFYSKMGAYAFSNSIYRKRDPRFLTFISDVDFYKKAVELYGKGRVFIDETKYSRQALRRTRNEYTNLSDFWVGVEELSKEKKEQPKAE